MYSPSETSNDPVGFIPLTQVSRSFFLFYLFSFFFFAFFVSFPDPRNNSIAPLTHPSQPHNKTIFEVKTEQRSYHLMAECDDDRDIWVSGLSNSVAFWKVPYFFVKEIERGEKGKKKKWNRRKVE